MNVYQDPDVARQPQRANDQQYGGNHYKRTDGGEEHWDRVWRLEMNYFQGCATKYIERYQKKGGVEDLKKARHFIDKLIELEQSKEIIVPVSKPAPVVSRLVADVLEARSTLAGCCPKFPGIVCDCLEKAQLLEVRQ